MADYGMDKVRFGEFVARERKGRGMTQRELAQRLFISDKAVSKWERGLSLPDVTLLLPLAEALGVTAAELLEGRRMEAGDGMEMAQVEALVKRTISLSEEPPEGERARRRKNALRWGGWCLVAAAELLLLWALGYPLAELLRRGDAAVLLFLAFLFGCWFWPGARERLPACYDEYPIHCYSDGIFCFEMAGVRFHNGNWPHILRGLRVWSAAALVGTLPLYLLLEGLAGSRAAGLILLPAFLAGLFLPAYLLGKRYE